MKILVTNSKGQTISSDLSSLSADETEKNSAFAKKILTFAEIALGKTA